MALLVVFNEYLILESEQVALASEFLNRLAEIAPVRIVRGNHDYSVKAKNRKDSVYAIVKSINNPKVIYYDENKIYEESNILFFGYLINRTGNVVFMGAVEGTPEETMMKFFDSLEEEKILSEEGAFPPKDLEYKVGFVHTFFQSFNFSIIFIRSLCWHVGTVKLTSTLDLGEAPSFAEGKIV